VSRPAGGTWQHNLPVPLTAFIGREREVGDVARLLDTVRLLTLTGAPGVGKTRLALEVATARLDPAPRSERAPGLPEGPAFADGVWLVELAPLTNPDLVPQVVAATLGVRERPGSAVVATLADALRTRHLLLVLDNCEHLLGACAALVDSLLRACPRLQILATSREALGISGETTFPVPALTLPEPEATPVGAGPPVDDVLASEAGRLFADRAQAVLPTFRVAENNAAALALVCRRLDGIPLALELAAARVTALTPAQLAHRLDDCFRLLSVGRRTALPRQQTLRATLDWSHALLSEPECQLLRRLSVFAGAWTLEAAEEVCAGDGLTAAEILPLLVQLVEKSLVVAEEQDGVAGYRLLQTVRQYGAEKLREAGEEAALRDRHLAWCAAVAEQAEEPLWSPDQVAWFARLKAKEDNLRAALEWSTRSIRSPRAPARPEQGAATVEAGLRLGGALWHFWNLRGHLSEGRARVLELLATGLGGPAARAKALHAAAYLTFVQGDPHEAMRLAEEAVSLGRQVVHPFILASALSGVATGMLMSGDPSRATALCEEGLAVCRQAGERRGMYYSLYGLAEAARSQGDAERAIVLMEEAHGLTRAQGDPWSIAFALSILGNLVLLRGDAARAGTLQRESLALRHAIEDAVGIGRCLDGLGWVAGALRRPARAVRLFGAAEALRERVGAAPHPPWRAEHERWTAAAWVELGEEAFAAGWAEGRALSLDQAIAYALAAEQPTPTGATAATPARPAPAAGSPGARPPAGAAGGLSPRELEVARLIARGQTNRRIAEALVIAEWTVDTHVRHILNKLGFRSRAQVAAWATERGLAGADG
jgi:predicted ATPase/DNA-binding CsgD family transcriptional regulator